MISKFQMKNLRNAEHFQFISSTCDIFTKHSIDAENLGPLYDELSECRNAEEASLAAENGNEKIREKNDMDSYRDKLHSKLFNYLKSILCDEKDARFDDAQRVMKVLKETGNPTQLAENAESAVLTALGNRLATRRDELEATGAREMVDALMEANRQFIALEKECREITAAGQLNRQPSMSAARKQTDPVYRSIVNAINGYAGILSKKDVYKELVAEMNTLVEKYDNLLAGRKGGKQPTD
jgi:chaperonin GroEL (HSP60 family)